MTSNISRALSIRACLAVSALALWTSTGAHAEDDFYRGKQIRMIIGFGAGGSYDLYARAIARHLGKHLPGNPVIVPVSMPTAGSLNAANYIYNSAPKDGTVIGTVASGAPTMPLFYPEAKFDPAKMTWIGSAAKAIHLDVVSTKVPVNTIEDLRRREVVLGSTGPGAAVFDVPQMMNAIAHFHYRLVMGYRTVADISLAITRGEVEGVSGTTWDYESTRNAHAYRDGEMKIVMQYGREKIAQLPDVPSPYDLVTNKDDRAAMNLILFRQEMGKPYIAPPDMPPERVAMLRKAFMETMSDPEYIADAEKIQLDISPLSGEAVQKIVEDVAQTPLPIVDRVRAILNSK
jgi:tripartite-type tricarboxylate transporter receptor subunit TctC